MSFLLTPRGLQMEGLNLGIMPKGSRGKTAQDMMCLGEGDQNQSDESPARGNMSRVVIILLADCSLES